jgi:hypothetical protein
MIQVITIKYIGKRIKLKGSHTLGENELRSYVVEGKVFKE